MTNTKNWSADRPEKPGDRLPSALPRTYTVAQLADILQIDPRTVRTKARAGTWPSLDFGPRTIRFTETHLEAILATSEAAPPLRHAPARRRNRPPHL